MSEPEQPYRHLEQFHTELDSALKEAAEQDVKDAEKIDELKEERLVDGVTIAASRAIFIAGFSFDQVERFAFTVGYNAYVGQIMGTFVFALLSAAVSDYILFYLTTLDSKQQRAAYVKRSFNHLILVFILFGLAKLLDITGLMFIGFSFLGADHPDRWIPFVAMAVSGTLAIIWLVPSYFNWKAVHRVPQAIEDDDDDDCPFTQLRLGRATAMLTTTIFVTGFGVNGIFWYKPGQPVWGRVYYVLISIAGAAGIVNVLLLAIHMLAIRTLLYKRLKSIYVKKKATTVLWGYNVFLFGVTLFIFPAAVAFVGFGTNLQRESIRRNTLIIVGTFVCVVGLMILHLMLIKRTADRATNDNNKSGSDEDGDAQGNGGGTGGGGGLSNSLGWQSVQARISTLANQATIYSGFCFLNLVVFRFQQDQKVFSDGSTPDEKLVQASWYTTLIVFLTGFSVAVLASYLGYVNFWTEQSCRKFVSRIKIHTIIITVLHSIALILFITTYAYYGLNQFEPRSYIPMIYSIIGLVVVLVAAVLFFRQYKLCFTDQQAVGCTAGHQRILQGVDSFSTRALFFGGFSYIGTNFYLGNGSWDDNLFLVSAGLAFTSSFVAVTINTLVKWLLHHIVDPNDEHNQTRMRERFVQRCKTLVPLPAILFNLALLGYCGFLCFMGRQKKHLDDYEKYSWVFVVGGITAFLFSLFWGIRLLQVRQYVKTVQFPLPCTELNGIAPFDVKKFLDQISATALHAAFVAGGSLELPFFLDPIGPDWLVYLTTSIFTLTGVLSIATLFVSTTVSAFTLTLPNEMERMKYCRLLQERFQMASFVFQLNSLSLCGWLIALAGVGYSFYSKFEYISIIWSAVGCIGLFVGWQCIRATWLKQYLAQLADNYRLQDAVQTSTLGLRETWRAAVGLPSFHVEHTCIISSDANTNDATTDVGAGEGYEGHNKSGSVPSSTTYHHHPVAAAAVTTLPHVDNVSNIPTAITSLPHHTPPPADPAYLEYAQEQQQQQHNKGGENWAGGTTPSSNDYWRQQQLYHQQPPAAYDHFSEQQLPLPSPHQIWQPPAH